MLKKMIILGVIGFVAVAALKGTKFASYVRTEVDGLRDRVDAAIPPEKEITRLRGELKQLDKDGDTLMRHVAQETVKVANLGKEVTKLTAQQNASKADLESRATAIKSAEGYVTFNGKQWTVEDAKAELEADVKRYARTQEALETQQQALVHHTSVRDTLVKQLDELKAQKESLSAVVNAAEAELNQLKLAQMQSKYQTDGTRLAKIKEDLEALNNKLAVEREKLKLVEKYQGKGTASPTSTKSVDEIMSAVNGKKPEPTPKTGTQSKAD